MSYLHPDLAQRVASARALQSLPSYEAPGSVGVQHTVAAAITARRAEIADLEADWAAASERAAARSLGGPARLGPRETWDRATWSRYLAAAAECQDLYQPRLRRLYAELAQLEAAPLANAMRPRRAA